KYLGDLKEQPLPIQRFKLQGRSESTGRRLSLFPLNLHHALWFALELIRVGTVCTVNRDSPAAGYEAKDFVSRNRLTTLGELRQHIGASFHQDAGTSFGILRLRALLRARAFQFRQRRA